MSTEHEARALAMTYSITTARQVHENRLRRTLTEFNDNWSSKTSEALNKALLEFMDDFSSVPELIPESAINLADMDFML